MFLPTGDTPNPKNYTPWVTWTLIAINLAVYLFISLPLTGAQVDPRDPRVREYAHAIRDALPPGITARQFVAQINAYDLFVFEHGYKSGAGEWRDLVFSMFLHGGLMHLFGNMLFLWIYGDNVEHRLGRFRFLLAYLATGIAATLFFCLFSGKSLVPLVGASGAISGVLGLYFLLFPRNQVKVFVFLFPFIMEHILLPARLVLGLYLVIDNIMPFVIGAGGGVAHGAHIGGFLAGWGAAWAGERHGWRAPGGVRMRGGPTMAADAPPPDPYPVLLREAIAAGDAERALALVQRVSSSDLVALPVDACIRLAAWIDASGYGVAAGRILRGRLGRVRDPGDRGRILVALGELRLRQGQHAPAYQHLLEALDITTDPAVVRRARAALERVARFRR